MSLAWAVKLKGIPARSEANMVTEVGEWAKWPCSWATISGRQEMGVGQVAGLQQVLQGGEFTARSQTSPGGAKGGAEGPRPFGGKKNIGNEQVEKIGQQFRRQVIDPGSDPGHRGMAERFPRLAHRKKPHGKSQFFQEENLIGDKSLGNAWVSFENIG